MIAPSLAYFIGNNQELRSLGLGLRAAFAKTPDTATSEQRTPFCLVSPLTEPRQELWVIGDAQRKENPIFQVCFYCTNDEQRRVFKTRFRKIIESAKANDSRTGTHLVPGIDFLAFADLMLDSGDQRTYLSGQPGWFDTPVPVVYKNEDANGEPIVLPSIGMYYGEGGYGEGYYGGENYVLSSEAGTLLFPLGFNTATDKIRATFKFGVIDFNIVGVDDFETAQDSDVANVPQRYAVAFTLETHYYIKTNANRYL